MVERILKYSTKDQSPHPEPLKRFFCPIISIDHLSQHFQDLPVDDILAIGDQALLYNQCALAVDDISKHRLSISQFPNPPALEPITEPDVFGPLVDDLYGTLFRLKHRHETLTHRPCEVLLYLSGHGMDPGNICLVPDEIKSHPEREDIRDKDPDKWYNYLYSDHKEMEQYLDKFYEACANSKEIGASRQPLGFVGGEVFAHQRGFIGVLGVLGLWCHAHCEPKGFFDHLVIVADCCFAGIWGNTLKCIMESEPPSGGICQPDTLKEYREILQKYPVSIQCATIECEASHGGLFTPLWYFLNDPGSAADLKRYQEDYERQPVRGDDGTASALEKVPVPDNPQHPWYISTSLWQPTWNCFDDPAFFAYLHGRQLQELEYERQQGASGTSPLAQPYVMALKSEASSLCKDLQKKLSALRCLIKFGGESDPLRGPTEKSIITIKQSLTDLHDFLVEGAQRSQCTLKPFVLNSLRQLKTTYRRKLGRLLPVRDVQKSIPPGVYVFQGGIGDMSLIVTPRQENVILIDGTKTAKCFKAAWDSTLRYLPRITHIIVTHHDEDHTTGIQLLLARYDVDCANLPDLTGTTIYMNTRAKLIHKNFKHEEEIETLAGSLELTVESLIVPDDQRTTLLVNDERHFLLEALLPKESLVAEVRPRVPEEGKDSTGQVHSRGGTTAANVLSINLVAVWKNRDAYLFTGDAHLKDVTEAARDFLRIKKLESFKYADVPHHGSRHSNVRDVIPVHCGLAGIPADNYLISHCGNHQNPSHETVTDILQSDMCQKLHFLYSERKRVLSCGKHEENTSWHCPDCVKAQQHCPDCVEAQQPCPVCVQAHLQRIERKIDTTLDANGPFKFFPFQ